MTMRAMMRHALCASIIAKQQIERPGPSLLVTGFGLAFRAPTTHKVDDQAYQYDQPKPAATDCRPTDIKAAATEQEEKYKNKDEKIHGIRIRRHGLRCHGALPCLSSFRTAVMEHKKAGAKSVCPGQAALC
jgi:hypothetical protein